MKAMPKTMQAQVNWYLTKPYGKAILVGLESHQTHAAGRSLTIEATLVIPTEEIITVNAYIYYDKCKHAIVEQVSTHCRNLDMVRKAMAVEACDAMNYSGVIDWSQKSLDEIINFDEDLPA